MLFRWCTLGFRIGAKLVTQFLPRSFRIVLHLVLLLLLLLFGRVETAMLQNSTRKTRVGLKVSYLLPSRSAGEPPSSCECVALSYWLLVFKPLTIRKLIYICHCMFFITISSHTTTIPTQIVFHHLTNFSFKINQWLN